MHQDIQSFTLKDSMPLNGSQIELKSILIDVDQGGAAVWQHINSLILSNVVSQVSGCFSMISNVVLRQ